MSAVDDERLWTPARQLRLTAWGAALGLVIGAAVAGFLRSLDWANRTRLDQPWLLWALPVGGALVVWFQTRHAADTLGGTLRVMRQIRRHRAGVPFAMAPMVWAGSVVTHLLGGSAGREGAALQISAGITGGAIGGRRTTPADRSLLQIVALAAGFGSAFGVPLAGIIFALEVAPQSYRNRFGALPAAGAAALTAHWGRALVGVHAEPLPTLVGIGLREVAMAAVIAPLFGVLAWAFLRTTERFRGVLTARVANPVMRPVLGGVAIVALTLIVGNQEFNGGSAELLTRALAGGDVGHFDWLLKLVFTAVTVGSGFLGGEVLPLSVMGATAGGALAAAVDAPAPLFAAVGLTATVGAALNAPLACAAMGAEFFGSAALVPLLAGCLIARVCSSRHSLYSGDHAVPAEAQDV
ncbi:MAG: hypothetical protein GX868_16625 [Actinobacteria bacterium]|nr:hypothetical protein [Actinomycetota bacterium]